MTIRVYIAGPYTRPDPRVNTHNAIHVANTLMEFGFVPFVPHLSHFWHTISPKSYTDWMEYDLHWVAACQALLRMPGKSDGADVEVEHAKSLGIPVFDTFEQLHRHFFPNVIS